MNTQTREVATTGLGGDLLAKMQSGIASSRAQTIISGGKPFLRLLRDGMWVFGQRDEEVQEGSSWAINVLSLQHGWCCWPKGDAAGSGGNRMLGESMAPVYAPRPASPEPINGNPFSQQVGMDLRCLDGSDMGTEVQYKGNSRGGINAFDTLLSEVQKQLVANPDYPCPVVQLDQDHYQHSTYGKIYIPIFTIVDWCDLTGKLQSEAGEALPAPTPEPVQQATTSTRSSDAVAAPAKPAKPTVEAPKAAKPRIGPKPGKESRSTARTAPVEPAPTVRRRPVRR